MMETPTPQPEMPKQPENRQMQAEVLPDATAITKKLLFQQPFTYSPEGKSAEEEFQNVPIQLTVLSIRKIGEFGTYYEVGVHKDQKLGLVHSREVKEKSVPWNTRMCLIPSVGTKELLIDAEPGRKDPRSKISLPQNADLYFPVLEVVIKDDNKFFRIGAPLGNSTLKEGFPCWVEDKKPDRQMQCRIGIMQDKTELTRSLATIKYMYQLMQLLTGIEERNQEIGKLLQHMQKEVAGMIGGNRMYEAKNLGQYSVFSDVLEIDAQDLRAFTQGDYRSWLKEIGHSIDCLELHLACFDKRTPEDRWNAVKGRPGQQNEQLYKLNPISIRTNPQKDPTQMRLIISAELP